MAVVESGPTQVQRVLAKGAIADPFPTLEAARSDPGRQEKIRQIRRSRRICSAGTGFSPRAWSEAAVSKPRPPRIWTISSATCQAISEQYSLANAASMRLT